MSISWEKIESLRDIRYRRLKRLQVTTESKALDFINDVGFCFVFAAKNSELPCLWHAVCGERNPVMPEHIQHDWSIGMVWQTKDSLPAQKKVYYGKAIKNRPAFISLEFFPFFYRLSDAYDGHEFYVAQYMRGELSPAAKRIMDALSEQSPQITRELKQSSGYTNPQKRYQFDRAIAELQMKMFVVKIAETYDPFMFVWDLVERRFSEETAIAKTIKAEDARKTILRKYFENVIVSNSIRIQRLFGWGQAEINSALADLREQNEIHDIFIDGEKKSWIRIL